MSNTPEAKELTPVYLSVSRLDKVIDLISNRNFSNIQPSTFEGYGFNSSDARLAINALEFLGLINESGEPTELLPKLRLRGDARKKEFEQIIRTAYKKLFNAVDAPQELPSDQLTNEFVVNYKLSNRVISSAIPAFLKLCEYAGLREEKAIRKAVSADKKPKITEPKKLGKPHTPNTGTSHGSDMTAMTFAGGKLIMGIDVNFMKETQLSETLQPKMTKLIKAAQDLEDEYREKQIKNKPPEKKPEGS